MATYRISIPARAWKIKANRYPGMIDDLIGTALKVVNQSEQHPYKHNIIVHRYDFTLDSESLLFMKLRWPEFEEMANRID